MSLFGLAGEAGLDVALPAAGEADAGTGFAAGAGFEEDELEL